MKFNKSIIFASALAIASVFASCGKGDYWDGYNAEEDTYSFAATTSAFSFPASDEVTEISVPITRSNTAAEASIEVTLADADANLTLVNPVVEFAAGQATADCKIAVGEMEPGVVYGATLSFPAEVVSLTGKSEIAISVTKELVWSETPVRGYLVDGTIGQWYGVNPAIIYAIDIYKAEGVEQYRYESPFSHVATDHDGYGYVGYPYNADGDCDEKTYWHQFIIEEAGVTLVPTAVGMDWGSGVVSVGTIYGYMSSNSAYPLGIYHEAEGYIEFPPMSLFINEANYGTGVCNKYSTYIFMNVEALVNNYPTLFPAG